ncbi:MAG: hypothetical protein WCK67_12950 [bacterium]
MSTSETTIKLSFIPIPPEQSIKWTYQESLCHLNQLVDSDNINKAFDINKCYKSPVADKNNSAWFKKAKIIGINPRICKTYWGIVKYAMTFPEDSIHIMPLFESGNDGAIYAQSSWELNEEFLDFDLIKLGYNTAEKQLKLAINVLHSMNKCVGFDVLPHVDNFSELVFLNPSFFEWVKLNESKTQQFFPPQIDYNLLYLEIEQVICDFLRNNGDSENKKLDEKIINNFYKFIKEEDRRQILFGQDIEIRKKRRNQLINAIRQNCFESIPVTEHSPSRPILFDKIKQNGETNYAVFKVENISPFAKILGGLTPYKWYSIDKNGFPEVEKLEQNVWQYFIQKHTEFQKKFNFDFFRADMAHNQISHSHSNEDKNYDYNCEFWAKLKESIKKTTPYFATLAEAFYNNYYIDGFKDMINKDFDVVLGDLNFKKLNEEYLYILDDYINVFPANFRFSPCNTIITNDADRKENNDIFQSDFANEIRMFTALFMNTSSYMGIGFETREQNPIESRQYTSNYTNHQQFEYKWGENKELFTTLSNLRILYDYLKPVIKNEKLIWLKTRTNKTAAWIFVDKNNCPLFLFALNLEINSKKNKVVIDKLIEKICYKHNFKKLIFNELLSNSRDEKPTQEIIINKHMQTLTLKDINLGEFKVFSITNLTE